MFGLLYFATVDIEIIYAKNTVQVVSRYFERSGETKSIVARNSGSLK